MSHTKIIPLRTSNTQPAPTYTPLSKYWDYGAKLHRAAQGFLERNKDRKWNKTGAYIDLTRIVKPAKQLARLLTNDVGFLDRHQNCVARVESLIDFLTSYTHVDDGMTLRIQSLANSSYFRARLLLDGEARDPAIKRQPRKGPPVPPAPWTIVNKPQFPLGNINHAPRRAI